MKKYEEVIQYIRQMIANETICEGEKIPSVRRTAQTMKVSPMTVLEAYRRLEADGIIESSPRSGYTVQPRTFHHFSGNRSATAVGQADIKIYTAAVTPHPETERLFAAITQPGVVPLGAGMPDSNDLPSDELSRHLSRTVRTDPALVNRYSLGAGNQNLRRQIARHMVGSGCSLSPDDICIVPGITQGLILSLRATTAPGDTVAVESPGYYGFFSALNFLHLKAVEIPISPRTGLDLARLANLLDDPSPPKALIVAPTFSNPTGALMPPENRKRLVQLIRKHNLTLIEDDTYGELSFNQPRPAPLKSMLPNRIIYLGSFSKILAPGYRIAWVSGGRHHQDILRCLNMSVLSQAPALQMALAAYLQKGGLPQHLRRLCRKYHKNLRLLEQLVLQHFPKGTQTTHPDGGHFLWVKLPRGNSVQLAKKALQENISIAPGTIFSSRQHYQKHLRLNASPTLDDRTAEAIRTLGHLART